uniref:YIP1 family protein n=1 Tax=Roseburia sp. TaxID=2049040 RepID=UPI003FEEDAD1
MKKLKRIVLLCLVGFICLTGGESVAASQATTYTYTHDDKMNYSRTQDAYLPQQTITKLGLNAPEDMFIDKNNMMYIADTGNLRIVKYDISRGALDAVYTYEGFQTPKGIYVTGNGNIYVADSKAKAVFVFDKDFELIRTLEKPEVPAYGDAAYEPSKVAADESGNIYIVGEGVYNGIIQMSEEGNFLGFFAVNKADLSLFQKIQTLVFTREQLSRLLNRNPTTFANVMLDQRGIVYTVTLGKKINPIKKHKTNGSNMFAEDVYGFTDISDIWVDENLLIYSASKRGYIDVYTPEGEWLFEFGSEVSNQDVAGLYSSLSTLAVDQNGYIWTVDGIKGYLQSYAPTSYASKVYEALALYDGGHYEQALDVWSDVLAMNQMSVVAHDGIGKAYMSEYEFESAMEHFEVAGNHEQYSEAFWELRNVWLQKYLKYLLIAILILYLVSVAIDKFDREKKWKKKKAAWKNQLMNVKGIGDTCYGFVTARHPLDGYYDVRIGKKGSVLGASILYGLLFLSFMLYMLGKGFIYQYYDVQDLDVGSIVIGFFTFLGLFVVCNYLVTSINDGQGDLKQVYMTVAYAAVPLILALFSITVLSYCVTTNEAFFLSVILVIGVVWTMILVFLGLQTVHNYTVKETIKGILLTILLMFVVVVVVLLVTIMWEQVWKFLSTVGEELTQNVL